MPTLRIPIARKQVRKPFTPEVIEAFKHLVQFFQVGDCTCPPINSEKYWEERPRCASCLAYDKAEAELVALLTLKPWEVLENPHLANPYPTAEPEHPVNRRGRALWRRLETASGW